MSDKNTDPKKAQRISEVIERLKTVMKENGDLEIFIDRDSEWFSFSGEEFILEFDEREKVNVIVIK